MRRGWTYDSQHVNHWGTHVGLIFLAGVYDSMGNGTDLVQVGDQMELCIRFRAPPGSNHKGLDVAFSINDLTSSDLIVCTTYDGRGQGFLYGAGSYTVRFQLRNPLANGRYLLAAAVEDRSVGQIGFYEYLEGAHYFQCYSGTGLFGMFYPMIQRAVEGGG